MNEKIMNKITISDTEYATLWYHSDAKIVHHQFHKFIHGDEFRQVLEKGLEIFKAKRRSEMAFRRQKQFDPDC